MIASIVLSVVILFSIANAPDDCQVNEAGNDFIKTPCVLNDTVVLSYTPADADE